MARRALGWILGGVLWVAAGCGGDGRDDPQEPDRCAGVTCAALDQCHEAGACDPATGACSTPTRPDDTGCDDGDPDTAGDVCTAGACAGIDHCVAVTCQPLDPCHDAGVCDHAFGTCTTPAKPDGTPCDDANGATADDVCTSGVCAGIDRCAGVTCPPPDGCHDPGTCDHATGACSNPEKANATPCDDGNPATADDACTSGVCAGIDHCAGVTCPPPDGCHDAGVCADHATGACEYPDKADGTACEDGDANTAGDVCTGGVCAGVDHCAGVVCPPPDACHEAGVCVDHATGDCLFQERPDGTACTGAMAGPCFVGACSAGWCQDSQLPAGTSCGSNLACDPSGQCLGPPSVVFTDPGDGGSNLASTPVTLTFDTPMEPSTLTAQTAPGPCTGTVQVSLDGFASCVAFSAGGPQISQPAFSATFTPVPGLLIHRSYQLRVTTGAVGQNGLALAAAYTSTFATTNPISGAGAAHNESNAPEEVAFCALYDPPSIVEAPGTVVNLHGWVHDARYAGAYGSLETQVGYGPATANPEYEPGWTWSPASYRGLTGGAALYSGATTLPMSGPGTGRYAFRVSLDAGSTWTYCDFEMGPSPGAGSNVGATFDLTSLNVFTVQ